MKSLRLLAGVWGVLGAILILGFAVYRLYDRAAYLFSHDQLHLLQWGCVIIIVGFFAYAEGYHGFQKKFSPRVAARARYLSQHSNWINGLFAPLFCIGYFGTTKRRQISSIALTSTIIVLIVMVSMVGQPWRGMIDMGVIIGLVWGISSLLFYALMAFFSDNFQYDPELSSTLEQ